VLAESNERVTTPYLVTVLLDRECSTADVASDAVVAEFGRFQLVRIVNDRRTMLQRGNRVARLRIVHVPPRRTRVDSIDSGMFVSHSLLIEMAQFVLQLVERSTVFE
jgi:hypothetical protein